MLFPSALSYDGSAIGYVDDVRPLTRERRRPPDIVLQVAENEAAGVIQGDDWTERKTSVVPIDPGT
jgi:hypothetical protein